MTAESDKLKGVSVPLIRGEIFNRLTPIVEEPKEMAAIGQKGLPQGPTAFMSQGTREKDIRDQIQKNESIELPPSIRIIE